MADTAVFLCRRRRDPAICAVGTCDRHGLTKCEFPLSGRKAGQVCGASMCADHIHPGPNKTVICQAHAGMLARAREARR